MKKILAMALAALMLLSLAACSGKKTDLINTDDDIEKTEVYIIQGAAGEETFGTTITAGNTIEITSYSGAYDLHEVKVPDEFDGRPVTAIGSKAFYFANNITKITLPDTVDTIGEWAFSGCNYLTEVTGAASLTAIGKGAFCECPALKSVALGKCVTIGDFAFKGCAALADVTLPATLTAIGNAAYDGCTSLKSISIPSATKSLGMLAFNGCSALNAATLTDGTTEIGDFIFNGCASKLVITCPANSAAAKYAKEAKITVK